MTLLLITPTRHVAAFTVSLPVVQRAPCAHRAPHLHLHLYPPLLPTALRRPLRTVTTSSTPSPRLPSASTSATAASFSPRPLAAAPATETTTGTATAADDRTVRKSNKRKGKGLRKRLRNQRRANVNARHRHNDTAREQAEDKWKRVQPLLKRPVTAPAPQETPRMSDLRPESCPALVLNADYSPLSYMPLSLWPWQEVVKAVFLDRVTVVATYDVGVRSPGMIFPLPSVISLKQYRPIAEKKPAFTRFNVFLRDAFTCQYCGYRFGTHDLTFDHVVPRCHGGKTNWQNVVTACVKCNHSKGRFLLKELTNLKLRRSAKEPTASELQTVAKKFPPQYLHESWRDYVYWSQSLMVEDAEQ